MKRRTPPRDLTEAFRKAGLSWYLHGEAPDHVLRAYDGGPACWLAQFDEFDRPCSGELEVFHFIGRQRIRNVLRPLLLTDLWADGAIDQLDIDDLVELAEWDPRNAGPACEGHHRRYDNHLTPELEVPLEALPFDAVLFVCEWGFEAEAERKFTGSPAALAAQRPEAGTAGLQQQPPLVGAGADNHAEILEGSSTLGLGGQVSAGSGEAGPFPTEDDAASPGAVASPTPDMEASQ